MKTLNHNLYVKNGMKQNFKKMIFEITKKSVF